MNIIRSRNTQCMSDSNDNVFMEQRTKFCNISEHSLTIAHLFLICINLEFQFIPIVRYKVFSNLNILQTSNPHYLFGL